MMLLISFANFSLINFNFTSIFLLRVVRYVLLALKKASEVAVCAGSFSVLENTFNDIYKFLKVRKTFRTIRTTRTTRKFDTTYRKMDADVYVVCGMCGMCGMFSGPYTYARVCARVYAYARMGREKHSALPAHSASVDKMGAEKKKKILNIPQTYRKHTAIQKMEITCRKMGVIDYGSFGCCG